MIPILYESDEVLFESNGLGRLTDAISCYVTEERNGTYEAELVYPVTGIHYSDIQIGRIIYCTHDANRDPQPFDIYKRSAVINGTVTFYAHHISYRLNNIVCMPFTMTGSPTQVLSQIRDMSVATVPFYFYSNKTGTQTFTLSEPKCIRNILAGEAGSILDTFGTGEYKFDKFDVYFLTARGQDGKINIRYGKNMEEITEEKSIESRYSAVVPYWVDPDTGDAVVLSDNAVVSSTIPTDAAKLTDEEEIYITDENGAPIDLTYPIVEYTTLDLSDAWETQPTQAQLRAKAASRLESSQAWETDENIEIEYSGDVSEFPEGLTRVLLCDTVGVYYTKLGIARQTKVIRTEYDTLAEHYRSLELGKPKRTLVEAVTKKTTDVLSSYAKRSAVAQAIDNATNLITGATGGHVVFNLNSAGQPEEILVMDADNIVDAVNVVRINKNGIGFSTSGFNGPYTTAWTINGSFVADFITTGTLNANLIKSGTIASTDGDSSWNLVSGVIRSTDGTRSTRISAGRVSFYKGTTLTGSLRPAAWGNDYENYEGVVLLTDSTYLGLGHTTTENDYTYLISDIVINNGLNPSGWTERIIFRGNIRTSGYLVIGGNLTMSGRTFTFNNATIEQISYAGSVERIRITNGGLIVGNVASMTNFTSRFAEAVYFDENISCQSCSQRSDENLKDIEDWHNAYDDVLDELEPICFRWKDNDDGLHVGLGARHTAAILDKHGLEDSALVNRDEEAGYSINYAELSVMLLKRVQELEKRISELERRL